MISTDVLVNKFYSYSRQKRTKIAGVFANFIYLNALQRGLLDGIAGVDQLEAVLADPSLAYDLYNTTDYSVLTNNEKTLVHAIVTGMIDVYLNDDRLTGMNNTIQAIHLIEPDLNAVHQIIWSLMGEE